MLHDYSFSMVKQVVGVCYSAIPSSIPEPENIGHRFLIIQTGLPS